MSATLEHSSSETVDRCLTENRPPTKEHTKTSQGRPRRRDRHALLLYDVTLRTGAAMRIADYYTVDRGEIRSR